MVVTRSNHIHASGILTLSVNQCSTNGKSVYCCSSDETFGIWNCSDTGELEVDIQNTANKCQGVLSVYGEDVYLAESSQDVITGVDRQIVVKYGLSAFLPSHPLLTFSLEITALACNGKYLIAGSNDFMVKCLKLPDEWEIESPTVDRYEYDGVVLSISISPIEGEYFSVSTADGYVQIRPTLKTSQSVKKSIAKFKVCDQFSHIRTESPRIECVWQPNGKHLYIPSKGCVIAVECATWEKKKTITNPEFGIETFSVLAITSSDGNDFFMAASTIQGSITVWKQNGAGTQFQLLNIHKKIQQNIGIITSIVFNPQNDDILIAAYSEGYLCSMTGAKEAKQICGEITQNEFVESSNPLIDGEAIDDQNDDIDDLETDLGLIKSRFGFDRFGFNQQPGTNPPAPVTNYALQPPAEPCATIKGMGIPKIFSVGATPSCEEGKYLVWNSYGVIKSYKSEEECTIEINFHDSTIHHEIIMDNAATNYSFGDINADFIALASKRNSSKESELYIHHVTSWDHESRKWTQQMDQGEVIECLTLGHQFIAIYTNLRYLRIFTPSGTQRFVISLPGSFLTMCANGSKIATAHSTGGVLVESEDDYEHQIMLTQYEINALAGECSPRAEWNVPLAISPYSKLIWVQFSSAGNLVTMDDDCIVRLYLRQKRVWIPVVSGVKHLKDSETDFLWPISLSEFPRAQFRFIYCRNCKYPPINKTLPPITSVSIEIPTINSSVERSKLEAELMTNELQQIIARDEYLLHPNQAKEMAQLTQNYVANLLKLFSISCQSNRESRAAEIAHRATNSKIVQGLCNYAAKVQRPNLSEKVAAIGRERIARDRMETNEQMQKKREQEIGGKQKPLGMINSDLAGPNDESIIAPSKILMAKRKIPNLSSMMPPKNTKLINKNQPNPFAKQIREKENGNNGFGKEMDHQMEEEEEGEGDDVSSIGGGESELDSSICSSLFPTSIPMDLSSANNPFKKAKMTSASSIVSTSTYKNRGFAEKEDDNESIVDFFDDLTSSGKDKN